MTLANEPADEWQAEFTLTRMFAAPRDLVFRIWTDSKYVALWWGVDGATDPVCELDARPGGRWRIEKPPRYVDAVEDVHRRHNRRRKGESAQRRRPGDELDHLDIKRPCSPSQRQR